MKLGCLTLILIILALFLFSCAEVSQTYIPYNDTLFPVMDKSIQAEISPSVPIESAPLPPETENTEIDIPTIPEPEIITPIINNRPEEYVTFSLSGLHDEVLLQESVDAGQEYVDGTCYIGDSITLGLKVFKILPEDRVYSAGSIDPYAAAHNKIVTLPDGRNVTAPQAVGYYKPQRVVITLGTNSLSWCPEKAFISSYGQLIEDIRAESPETVVIIQSIPPVTESYEANAKKLTNENINRFNVLLLELAAEKSAYFLNTASVLKNEYGFFNEDYQSGDGLHHNQASYRVWLNYLRTHAVPTEYSYEQS